MYKTMTAEKLLSILQQIDPESLIAPNKVGNLAVLDPQGQRVIAVIDFLDQNLWEPQEE